MYIILVGGGTVGYHLSKSLLAEGHEVLVLEKNAQSCERFEDDLGSVCVRGDGCEVAVLTEAGTSRADVFIAITNEDDDNLVACQIAKYKFNVPRTIARVNDPKNVRIFEKLGVDCTVAVPNLIFHYIEEELPAHPLMHLLTSHREGSEIIEVKLHDKSKAVGKSAKDLELPADFALLLLIRNGQNPQVPGDAIFQTNDRIIALTPAEHQDTLYNLLIGTQEE